MSDNPLDRIPSFDRVSIRAVVVADGEDPGPALAQAGIVEPVELPVVFGEEAPDRNFGDGSTDNLTGVLEFDQEDDGAEDPPDHPAGSGDESRRGVSRPARRQARPSGGRTTNLPGEHGVQPLAPVRPGGERT